jgi:hypothetical protein
MTKNSGVSGKTIPQLIRAQAAEVRQRERASRSDAYQLALLDNRPGQSLRERRRLASAS